MWRRWAPMPTRGSGWPRPIERLAVRGCRVVLCEAGPTVLGELVAEGLVDELFLTLAPRIAGREASAPRPGLVDGVAFTPSAAPTGRLRSVMRAEDHLFLRYVRPGRARARRFGMSDIGTIVIVGAGLTAAKAAETLRAEGFEGRVVMLGDEPQPPYLRPPLSKDYLRGESGPADAYVQPVEWYADERIELRTSTRVTALEPDARAVVVDGGERVGYDRLLVATGAAPRRLDVPGAGLAGIHALRTMADADAIRDAATRARRAAVIGGGWIGAEVAASLRQLGLAVTIVMDGAAPSSACSGRRWQRSIATCIWVMT
ncbi:MAG: FAD-dependent oxidoreductase [Chloroflexota bacterium]